MDRYSLETRCWLDLRFDPEALSACGHSYEPYQPVAGLSGEAWTPGNFLMAARWVRLAHLLRRLNAVSLLDVGGAEGLVSRIMSEAAGVQAVSLDLSLQAGLRAREFLGVHALAAEAPRLPFASRSFDVVYCGEVIEHLSRPLAALLEMARVARVALVVTSEAVVLTEAARRSELAARSLKEHMDRSVLCPSDLSLLLPGWTVHAGCQVGGLPSPVPAGGDQLAAALAGAVAARDLVPPAQGLFAVALRQGPVPQPDETLQREVDAVLRITAPPGPAFLTPPPAALSAALRARLRCPLCRHGLRGSDPLTCSPCNRAYRVHRGVPDLCSLEDEGEGPPLGPLLQSAMVADLSRVPRVLALERLLRFELPEPRFESRFLLDDHEGWSVTPELEVQRLPGGGLALVAKALDPALFSPRVDRLVSSVSGFRLRVRTTSGSREFESAQVYIKTLHRPLWWEAGSSRSDYRADGEWHDVILPMPAVDLPADDELLALRLDPADDACELELRSFDILPA